MQEAIFVGASTSVEESGVYPKLRLLNEEKPTIQPKPTSIEPANAGQEIWRFRFRSRRWFGRREDSREFQAAALRWFLSSHAPDTTARTAPYRWFDAPSACKRRRRRERPFDPDARDPQEIKLDDPETLKSGRGHFGEISSPKYFRSRPASADTLRRLAGECVEDEKHDGRPTSTPTAVRWADEDVPTLRPRILTPSNPWLSLWIAPPDRRPPRDGDRARGICYSSACPKCRRKIAREKRDEHKAFGKRTDIVFRDEREDDDAEKEDTSDDKPTRRKWPTREAIEELLGRPVSKEERKSIVERFRARLRPSRADEEKEVERKDWRLKPVDRAAVLEQLRKYKVWPCYLDRETHCRACPKRKCRCAWVAQVFCELEQPTKLRASRVKRKDIPARLESAINSAQKSMQDDWDLEGPLYFVSELESRRAPIPGDADEDDHT